MTVSEKIFEIMDSKGISQSELATRTGITQSTISDWKNKGHNPNSDKLPLVCKALGIRISDLFEEDDNNSGGEYHIITKDDELWTFVEKYRSMKKNQRKHLIAYFDAMMKV